MTHRNSRTKLDILIERLDFLRDQVKLAENYIEGLAMTNCGLNCGGCGMLLETEADFADHFIVRDENYLNLGNCPDKD